MKQALIILAAAMWLAVNPAAAAEMVPLAGDVRPAPAGGHVLSIGPGHVRFSLAELERFPLYQTRMATPWSPDGATWTGIRLADLLAAGGLAGKDVVLRARDDYTTEVEARAIAENDPMLATRMNGETLDPTVTGPLMLVWPKQAEKVMDGSLSEKGWIWGVVAIAPRP